MGAMRIDFISDVMCPWCVIGLGGLRQAIAAIGDAAEISIHPQPFELNPDMGPEGENVRDHITRKYGAPSGASSATRETIRQRAADIGFVMNSTAESRIWNSFDAHRLIHWAEQEGGGPQAALVMKTVLFASHFTDNANISDRTVLADAAGRAGFDAAAARTLLDSDAYVDEVRGAENYWRREGIQAVPTAIINGRYVISGGQPADKYERALRAILAEI